MCIAQSSNQVSLNCSLACCMRTDRVPEDEQDLTNHSKYPDTTTQGCYCLTYQFKPVCMKIEQEKPLNCICEFKCWRAMLVLFFAGLIAIFIWQCVTNIGEFPVERFFFFNLYSRAHRVCLNACL